LCAGRTNRKVSIEGITIWFPHTVKATNPKVSRKKMAIAIQKIGDKVKSHILGMRDPSRPLTLLVPGPTGVGKTELMMYIARACDLPFFMIREILAADKEAAVSEYVFS
jgi:2-phosphoglycerate kinase